MEHARRTFIPAAGVDWALPLYDPLVKLIGGDQARRTIIGHAAIQPGHRLLDVGCGTGSLAIEIALQNPAAEVVALDPDPRALARARRKAARAGASIRLDRGFADGLPYPDAAFDRVVSSFMFHHLQGDEKAGMLREARRVLKPGGTLYLLDFGGREPGDDPILGRMAQAGFENARRIGGGSVIFGLGAYSCFEGTSPAAEARHAS